MMPVTLSERVARLSVEAQQRLAARLGLTTGSTLATPHAADATDSPTTPVAYYVTNTDRDLSPDALRQFLGQTLPAHLVPSQFRRIERIPRTVHGKVDTAALPDPVPTPSTSSPESASTPSEIESELLSIWRAVLGVTRVGVRDSFFELGGDSLLAIRLLGRIRERWSIELSMADMFDHPTVAGAATQIESVLWARHSGRARTAEGSVAQEEVEF